MTASDDRSYLHPEARAMVRLLELAALSPHAPTTSSHRLARPTDRVALVQQWVDHRDPHTPIGLLEDAGEHVAAEELQRLTSHGDFARATWHLAGVIVQKR